MSKKKRKSKKKKWSKLKHILGLSRALFGRVKSTTSIPDKTKYNRKRKHKKDYLND